jgi:hypothetical protein
MGLRMVSGHTLIEKYREGFTPRMNLALGSRDAFLFMYFARGTIVATVCQI